MTTYNLNTSRNGNFTKTDNALFLLYTRLPDFKADHAMLYTILTHFHNAEYGYAFPTVWELALRLNCSTKKVSRMKSVLVKYGLVDIRQLPGRNNDVYYLKPPITDEVSFYAAHPEAREYYEKQLKASEADRRRSADNLVSYRQEKVEKQPTFTYSDGESVPLVDVF
ncbi:hypothetical protein [Aneurinibacillus aneurinilyticus]|uniref:hypothetical protein n=1 Tax=Aneurinibacillus aneurinilyticus TaxID=1391 RepID=UPI0023F0F3CB|nr:hypothetical protein [Aneurinibacillus aneurinilyticus]